MRNTLFKVARRDLNLLTEETRLYFCEDHFDLEHDMVNYIQYKIMGAVKRIRLKPYKIPENSRFKYNRKHNSASSTDNLAVTKKLRVSMFKDYVQDHIEDNVKAP